VVKLQTAELLAAAQNRLDRIDTGDALHLAPIDMLVNRVLLLRDLAHLAEQSHTALADIALGSLGARIFAMGTARSVDERLLSTCVDVAALALHIATQVEEGPMSNAEDSALVWAMRQGIVERIDAAGGSWERLAAKDFRAPVLNMVSDALLAELRSRLAAGETIRARHLRALGLPGMGAVEDSVADDAIVSRIESRGAPVIRVHFHEETP
jgi:hypothetical protein